MDRVSMTKIISIGLGWSPWFHILCSTRNHLPEQTKWQCWFTIIISIIVKINIKDPQHCWSQRHQSNTSVRGWEADSSPSSSWSSSRPSSSSLSSCFMPMMVNADSVGRREAEAGPLVYLAESIFHHSTTCPHSEPQPAKKTKKKTLGFPQNSNWSAGKPLHNQSPIKNQGSTTKNFTPRIFVCSHQWLSRLAPRSRWQGRRRPTASPSWSGCSHPDN